MDGTTRLQFYWDGVHFLNEGPNSIPPAGQTDDPLFVSPVNPGVITDVNDPNFAYTPGFQLQSGSPAKDVGLHVSTITGSFVGNGTDMGAYEFGQNPNLPPPPPPPPPGGQPPPPAPPPPPASWKSTSTTSRQPASAWL